MSVRRRGSVAYDEEAVRVRLVEPFTTALKAAFGVLACMAIIIWGSLLLLDALGRDMSTADVRAVCAAHDGVRAVDDDTGLLLPSYLVVCRDGYVGEPKP